MSKSRHPRGNSSPKITKTDFSMPLFNLGDMRVLVPFARFNCFDLAPAHKFSLSYILYKLCKLSVLQIKRHLLKVHPRSVAYFDVLLYHFCPCGDREHAAQGALVVA